ncbi:MAG: tyrosine-type recombinase/integrase [Lentisphaerales bacterium]|nr:tyrosine-type recombinase/integrase [Lentisphaerales bacterium]
MTPTEYDGRTKLQLPALPMTLFIPNSKGRKDRYVPLPLRAYLLLRDYWRIKRPSSLYIFVNAKTSQPYCRESLEKSFSVARDKCALNKCYTFHTLRHSYATCLMEAGIDIRMLQVYLGHSSLKITMMYIHMSNRATTEAQKTVERLFSEFNY